jgi:hypothetical protein
LDDYDLFVSGPELRLKETGLKDSKALSSSLSGISSYDLSRSISVSSISKDSDQILIENIKKLKNKQLNKSKLIELK